MASYNTVVGKFYTGGAKDAAGLIKGLAAIQKNGK
jgi:hypothetical protein